MSAINVEFDTAPQRAVLRKAAETLGIAYRVVNSPSFSLYPSPKEIKSIAAVISSSIENYLELSSRSSHPDSLVVERIDPENYRMSGYHEAMEIIDEIKEANKIINTLALRFSRSNLVGLRFAVLMNRAFIHTAYVTSRKRKWGSY